MSTIDLARPAPPARRSGRRLRWIALAAAGLLASVAGLYVYLVHADDRELREAVAEADRLDPGWRFEEIEAARAAVPDAENGARVVRAARALLPGSWMAPPPGGGPSLEDRMAEWTPPERLDAADLAELRSELAKAAAALDKARTLAEMPRGRHAVAWSADLFGTLVPHLLEVRTIARLLALDAIGHAEDGDIDGAVRSCRAALNAGRSLGDEPMLISQLVRAGRAREVVRALERSLAAGAASAGSLEAMQRALAEEAEAPSLLIAVRADRSMFFRALDLTRTGRFDSASYKVLPSMLGATVDDLIAQGRARNCEPAYLRHTTAVVEIARLSTPAQEGQLRELATPAQPLPGVLATLTAGGMDWVKLVRGFHRTQAELRCAAAALAAERYRLTEGRWPDRLDALVPRYLDAVPADPFDGRPLRWVCRPEGCVVYSLGPDRIDHGGQLNRKQLDEPGSDVGFQLWDAERR